MGAVSDADYKPCPHCERELHKWTRAKHVRTCPKRPEIADALRTALTGADGYAVTPKEYTRTRSKRLPTHIAITQTFGSWRAACAHFGVAQHPDTQRSACPHCGRTYTNIRQHRGACPQRPDVADALRTALTSADGCLASRDEYDLTHTPDLPNGNTLAVHFGGWAKVGAHFGIPVRSREAVGTRRGVRIAQGWARRRESAPAADDDPLLVGAVRVRTDYGEGDGLAVQGERRLAGGGVAYMLR